MELSKGQHPTVLSDVKNGLVKIAVAYTGRFERNGKRFEITSRDLEEMKRNLAAREVPIDYEHMSAQDQSPPGWAKAAGWMRKPAGISSFVPGLSSVAMDKGQGTRDTRKVLWAWAELTPACLAMVKQKEYRYFSPEIHWNETDEHGKKIGTRLAAGAVTNRPFLKDLPAIEISDEDYNGLFGIRVHPERVHRERVPGVGNRDRIPNLESRTPLLAMVALSQGNKLMDLDAVHVPAASRQVSVAYPQPAAQAAPPSGHAGTPGDGTTSKEKRMAKFSIRKLEDGPHAGKFGLYRDDELMMDGEEPVVFEEADLPAGRKDQGDADDGDAAGSGAPAAGRLTMREAAALAEMFRDGRIDPQHATALAESGKVRLGAIFRAQAVEKLVDQFVASGKVLPRTRGAAFRLALQDEASFRALLADIRPAVDLKTHGHSAPSFAAASAQEELDELVDRTMKEKKADYSTALTEVTRLHPDLWRRASQEVAAPARPVEIDEEGN